MVAVVAELKKKRWMMMMGWQQGRREWWKTQERRAASGTRHCRFDDYDGDDGDGKMRRRTSYLESVAFSAIKNQFFSCRKITKF